MKRKTADRRKKGSKEKKHQGEDTKQRQQSGKEIAEWRGEGGRERKTPADRAEKRARDQDRHRRGESINLVLLFHCVVVWYVFVACCAGVVFEFTAARLWFSLCPLSMVVVLAIVAVVMVVCLFFFGVFVFQPLVRLVLIFFHLFFLFSFLVQLIFFCFFVLA